MNTEKSLKSLEEFYTNANKGVNVTYGMAFSTTVVLGNDEPILGVKSCVLWKNIEKNGIDVTKRGKKDKERLLILVLNNEMILDKLKKTQFYSNEIEFKYNAETKKLCFIYNNSNIPVEVSEGDA